MSCIFVLKRLKQAKSKEHNDNLKVMHHSEARQKHIFSRQSLQRFKFCITVCYFMYDNVIVLFFSQFFQKKGEIKKEKYERWANVIIFTFILSNPQNVNKKIIIYKSLQGVGTGHLTLLSSGSIIYIYFSI